MQNPFNDDQAILSRKVYLVNAKDELLQHLQRISEPQSVDAFRETTVIMTGELDFERHIEGWGKGIIKAAKETFIENLFGEFCPFEDEDELFHVLGEQPYIDLFDTWFSINEVDYLKIEKDWKRDNGFIS